MYFPWITILPEIYLSYLITIYRWQTFHKQCELVWLLRWLGSSHNCAYFRSDRSVNSQMLTMWMNSQVLSKSRVVENSWVPMGNSYTILRHSHPKPSITQFAICNRESVQCARNSHTFEGSLKCGAWVLYKCVTDIRAGLVLRNHQCGFPLSDRSLLYFWPVYT